MRKHGGTPSRQDKHVTLAAISPPGVARGRFGGGQQSGLAGCKPPPLFTRGASSCSSQGRHQGEPWGASPRPSAPTYLPTLGHLPPFQHLCQAQDLWKHPGHSYMHCPHEHKNSLCQNLILHILLHAGLGQCSPMGHLRHGALVEMTCHSLHLLGREGGKSLPPPPNTSSELGSLVAPTRCNH